jgi:putative IMPACT (imprinted ancient) family translation regulator
MIAYRFLDESGCLVSDSDDDGEKGSGNKLSSLLELTDTQNCIVVVSRWYGGVHLGPARFKWIASVARQALEGAGFLEAK